MGRPISSARFADSSADCTIASRVTARASSGCGRVRILFHQLGKKFLIERAPVGADPHRLAVLDGHLDDVGELAVALVLEADVPRIDAVLVECLGAGRMIGQQLVADVVEVADQRRGDAALAQTVADVRNRRRRLVAIHRDADHFGARARQRCDLGDGALDISGVGIGHRLHDDRRAAADGDIPDHHLGGSVPRAWACDVALRRIFELVHEVSNIRFL